MTVDEIRELIALASETGIAELEVQRGENRVRIRRAAFAAAPQEVTLAAAAPAPVAAAEPPKEKAEKSADASLVLVKSPIVGTFYEGPSPGSPPFVRVGERVQPGKVLCIIESMKLMNEIEAETSGRHRKQAGSQRTARGVRGGAVCHPRGLRRSSSPTAAKLPFASSAPARNWGSRPWRSIRKPTATARTCASPTRPSASARPRARAATWTSPSIISAAEITNVDAIHPGYGFLSENAGFAEVCETSGIKFIGPKPDVIRLMGVKERARAFMREMGVPVLPGSAGVLQEPRGGLEAWPERSATR